MKNIFAAVSILLTASLTTASNIPTASTTLNATSPVCPAPWSCEVTEVSVTTYTSFSKSSKLVRAHIRSGYLHESTAVAFRGNIIYYEGLGDSMLNHQPLFEKLTRQGFRVIAFDYMGQGGSSGSMNDTRVSQIPALGEAIWKKYAKDLQTNPAKIIIGWSTGGLAAYGEALHNKDVKKVVLLAPGIVPKLLAGEQDPLRGKITHITLDSLNSQTYGKGEFNPHIDPIRPEVVIELPEFAIDFLQTAVAVQKSSMRLEVEGLVLMSGHEDHYVHAKATSDAFTDLAPHFKIREFPSSRHEIDNEREPIQSQAHQQILDFLCPK
jgi:alpha-beta hydrolase superfamily lysophospholipase